MTEGIYKADTYYVSINGKEHRGKFADFTENTVLDGVDKNLMFGIVAIGATAYKFWDGKWKNSFGGNWTTPPMPNKYAVEGDKLILNHYSGKVETTFIIDGDTLSSTNSANGVTIGFTFALEK